MTGTERRDPRFAELDRLLARSHREDDDDTPMPLPPPIPFSSGATAAARYRDDSRLAQTLNLTPAQLRRARYLRAVGRLDRLDEEGLGTLPAVRDDPGPVAHGLYGYNYRGCRCAACRQARRLQMREYRARNRKTGSGIFSRAATAKDKPGPPEQRISGASHADA